jgi:hypothetical protein
MLTLAASEVRGRPAVLVEGDDWFASRPIASAGSPAQTPPVPPINPRLEDPRPHLRPPHRQEPLGQGGRQPSHDHWRRDIRAMRMLLLDALELSHTEGKVPTILAREGEYSVALWSTSYGANGPARRCKNRRALPHPDPGEHSSDQQSATSGFHSTLSEENRSRESASPDDNAPEAKVGEARLAAPQSRL